MESFGEHSNKISDFIKGRQFLGQLAYYPLCNEAIIPQECFLCYWLVFLTVKETEARVWKRDEEQNTGPNRGELTSEAEITAQSSLST
jgi:hypothetical protein